MFKRHVHHGPALAAPLVLLAVLCVGRVSAADIYVTTFNDGIDPTDGVTSLREAVVQANAQAGSDTIHLQAGTYSLTLNLIDEDAAQSGDLDVTDTVGVLTILGVADAAGRPASIIDASESGDRILSVLSGARAHILAVALQGGGRNPAMGFAGGVFIDVGGSLEIEECEVRDNGGPGIAGPGIRNDGVLRLARSTVTRNTTPDECCGGIDSRGNTVIYESVISDNVAGGCEGGGICANGGLLTIERSSIKGNSAAFTGGGIAAFYTPVQIVDSTISDNTVYGLGGGIFFSTDFYDDPVHYLVIETTTISDNHALLYAGGTDPDFLGGIGGGIYVEDGLLQIRNTTVAFNSAVSAGGVYLGNYWNGLHDYSAFNALIGRNDGGDCLILDADVDLRLEGRNFIQQTAGCVLTGNNTPGTGLMSAVDPRLGPLKDNGGYINLHTWTHLPLPGSPVIDAGSCTQEPRSDQRGLTRPIYVPTTRNRRPPTGGGCDFGAAEYRQEDLDALGGVQVPIRWCVLRGTSATTDPSAGGPDNVALDRLASANVVLTSQSDTTLYLRSGANRQIADVQVIDHHDRSGSVTPDVYVNIDPGSEDLSEFLALINECRSRWSDLPGGLTAVLIRHFVDDGGQSLPVAGIGGRAIEGDCPSQLSSGRVMVVDGGSLDDPTCTLEMTPARLAKFLAHESGHAFSLRHGHATPTHDHTIDDDPTNPPDMTGGNLMEYGEPDGQPGKVLEPAQKFQAKEHALECVPGAEPLGLQPLEADLKTATDDDPADPGRIKILSFGIVLNPNDTATLLAETVNSPVTGNLVPPTGTTTYKFLADLDNHEDTGGTVPDDPSLSGIHGLEFIGTVTVTEGGGITQSVSTYLNGSWVSQTVGTGGVKELNVGVAQLCGNFTDVDPLVGASVQLEIPNGALIEAGWGGSLLHIQIVASETETGNWNIVPLDAKAPLLGENQDASLPVCAVTPATASPGEDATVAATGFISDTQLDVRLGDATLGTISTVAPEGNGVLRTTIPIGTAPGRALVEVRDPQSALQALCVVDVVDEPLRALCNSVTVSTDPNACTAATASVDAGSSGPNGGAVTIVQEPQGPYPLGTTTVNLTVHDNEGHSVSCTGVVTVVDLEAPSIMVTVSPQVLWPPNHKKMVAVTATVSTRDNCGASPSFVLTSITSNEPDRGQGNGDKPNDIQAARFGTPDRRFQLRAERDGNGSGRVYEIVFTARDPSGNTARGVAHVNAPHDQRR